ncbi:Transforming growth factor beta receptor type 3 [Channa argus]|uniref:Transforming growth factor beta receptor type 3 n=1 Tax=Channa argus TaxID=215402 RepID=A0A6G1QH08_CHAAH|nr:Transforming growth factor beta receptor type 3 [Channa argus]
MEGHMVPFALLLCITVAAYDPSQTCVPEEKNKNSYVVVREKLSGCWTNFTTKDNAEVHILNLNFPSTDAILSLQVVSSRQMNLIITSSKKAFCLYNGSTNVNFYIPDSAVTLYNYDNNKMFNMKDIPTQDEQLVDWARKKFGGVTSFTTIQNAKTISLTEGTKPGSDDCILANEDPSEKSFMVIESDPIPPSKYLPKSCSPQQKNTSDGPYIHIINIPENDTIRNVSLHVKTEAKTQLFLRGPQGTTWNIVSSNHIGMASNNDIKLFLHTIPPTVPLKSDNAEDVQQKALENLKASTFTSYTEVVSKNSTFLDLEITDTFAVTETTKEDPFPITTNPPHQMPLFMQLYISPDYRFPLNAKVQSNKRIYAEISGNTLGFIALTIKVISCSVRSKGSCPVKKDLPFIPDACSPNSCPNSTRVIFLLDKLQELTPTTWDLECSVQLCHNEEGLQGDLVATIRSNGPQGRVVKSFVFPRESDYVAVQTLSLMLNHSTQLTQAETISSIKTKEVSGEMIHFYENSEDVPAQEESDNQFLPSLPPLRTAAPMLALEAPKAHQPAAWHKIMVTANTSRATIPLHSHQ